ncbi:hypothetical protein B0H16DRAFT_1491390 [Mycena metata]|uniref:Uncharacterized protein n=1 Tax=Mycena metata TaxID=1033252 RepID=A0AAD7KGD8_9AGAR|nr:hypothetical protein B0H16DRAFT_1491390 [Mycena metata]
MPPTPVSARTTRNSTKVPVATSTPEKPVTPGKPRYCTVCKQPRKGHPRQGCPQKAASSDSDSPTRSVADALNELNLASSDASEDSSTGEENSGEVDKKPRKPFTRMPGTLLTPTSSFMYSHASQSSYKDETPLDPDASFSSSIPHLGLSQLSNDDRIPGDSTPRARTPAGNRAAPPPAAATTTLARTRTLTGDERAAFTASLTHLAKATVYVLPTADVPAICDAAAARGLSTHALPLDHADTLLVVGHTTAAVEVLRYQVEAKMHALVPPPPPGRGVRTVSATAKALVVGAVGAAAAWSVLAFS